MPSHHEPLAKSNGAATREEDDTEYREIPVPSNGPVDVALTELDPPRPRKKRKMTEAIEARKRRLATTIFDDETFTVKGRTCPPCLHLSLS